MLRPPKEETIDLKSLASAIRAKRGKRTLSEVAQELDVTVGSLSKFENAQLKPSLDTFVRICEWLEVEMDFYVIRGAA